MIELNPVVKEDIKSILAGKVGLGETTWKKCAYIRC